MSSFWDSMIDEGNTATTKPKRSIWDDMLPSSDLSVGDENSPLPNDILAKGKSTVDEIVGAKRDDQSDAESDFNPALHYPGTTAEQAAKIPPGFAYDPRTKQYRDVGLEAEIAGEGRGRVDAATTGIMQGAGMRFGDEAIGLIGNLEGRLRGENPEAMQNLRTEQARAMIEQDQENYGGTALAGEVAGAVTLPGAAMKTGAGWLLNTARAAGVGGLFGGAVATGGAEGDLSERAADIPLGVGLGMAGGAAAVPLAKVASWATQKFGQTVGAVLRQKKFFDGQKLTDKGRVALSEAGINPDEVGEAFSRDFARRAARSSEPVASARTAQMAEFGIPALRANATGDVTDFADLERARRGGMDQAAATRVSEVLDDQMKAARRAGETIATDLSKGNPADQFDAAIAVQDGLRKAKAASQAEARAGYEALEAAGGGVRGVSSTNMGTRIGAELKVSNVTINPQRTPNAAAALEDLDVVFEGAERGAVPFMEIERARQNLVRLRTASNRGSLGSDQFAMGKVVDAFDAKIDEVMTSTMMEGNEEALKLAVKARGLWREYSKTFKGKGAAAKFIQKMTDEDASPDDVAKWLFSSGKLGTGMFNSTLAGGLKKTLGETSEAWSSVRQGAFRQLIQKAEGTTQPGPQKMATNISEFFNSPSTRALSRQLFTKKERVLMLRYTSALKQMVPPQGAVNHSGTAYENSRAVQNAAKGIAASLGFAVNGPGGAVAGAAVTNAVQGAQGRAAMNKVLSSTKGTQALKSVRSGITVPPGFEAYDFTNGLFLGPPE